MNPEKSITYYKINKVFNIWKYIFDNQQYATNVVDWGRSCTEYSINKTRIFEEQDKWRLYSP